MKKNYKRLEMRGQRDIGEKEVNREKHREKNVTRTRLNSDGASEKRKEGEAERQRV